MLMTFLLLGSSQIASRWGLVFTKTKIQFEGWNFRLFFFFLLPFIGPLLWHMEVLRLGVQLEL